MNYNMQYVLDENYSIDLKTYAYKDDGKRLVMEPAGYLHLFRGNELIPEKIVWNETAFARVLADMELTIRFSRGNREKYVQVKTACPNISSFAYVGIKLEDNNMIRLAIGDPEKYILTDEIALNL